MGEASSHNGRNTRRKSSRKYGVLSLVSDMLLVSIFLSLLAMNYMNINLLHVLDQEQHQQHQAQHKFQWRQHLREHLDHNHPAKPKPTKTFHDMIREKKHQKALEDPNKNNHKHNKNQKPKVKAVRQKAIPGSDQSHIHNNSTANANGNNGDANTKLQASKAAIPKSELTPGMLVLEQDTIYKGAHGFSKFDAAPIVLPEHKLLFFTVPKVACTSFKFLFRRMAGVKNWDFQDSPEQQNLPHNPKYNNLKYLYDYSLEEANKMMTDPTWTRAIFVRDPKLRFLSAFLDKAVGNYGSFVAHFCCPQANQCKSQFLQKRTSALKAIQNCQAPRWDSRSKEMTATWFDDQPCCHEYHQCQQNTITIEGFLETIQTCPNGHWTPQSSRMEDKYWKYINFVGKMETIDEDIERLLKQVGAWDQYGKSGWGPNKDLSMTQAAGGSQSHTTGANSKIYQWFTPEKERLVEQFYKEDYANPAFNFTISNLTEPIVNGKILQHNDTIYKRGDWDGAPIVVEKYKLVFFTLPKVGATKWKQAFRNMEGHPDWKTIGGPKNLPHDPSHNGLKYLYDFPIQQAEEIMTSPDWTRAMFVRSPKDRFLSVYSELQYKPKEIDSRCCPHDPGCSSNLNNFLDFVHFVVQGGCYSTHWAPYSERFDPKWWPHIDFIGRLEDSHVDAERLMRQIGAWESVGNSGWGAAGKEAIFVKEDNPFAHVQQALGKYSSQSDQLLTDYYQADYDNPWLNFTSNKLYILEGHT